MEINFLKELLVDNRNVFAMYDERERLVEIYWNGCVSSEEYRVFCREIIRLCNQKDASKLLVDERKLKTQCEEDEAWIQSDWLHCLLFQTHVRLQAIIKPPHINLPSATITLFDGIFTCRHFSNTDQALQWFKTI